MSSISVPEKRMTWKCEDCEHLSSNVGAFALHKKMCNAMTWKLDPKVLVNLYKDGFSTQQIASLYSTSRGTIERRLKELGLEWRDRGGTCNANWKGGRFPNNGYWRVWIRDDHPLAEMRDINGTVAEHRLVVAEWLGRVLTKLETVHHKNGNTMDNALANLQLRSGSHGQGQVRRCGDCGSENIVCEEL